MIFISVQLCGISSQIQKFNHGFRQRKQTKKKKKKELNTHVLLSRIVNSRISVPLVSVTLVDCLYMNVLVSRHFKFVLRIFYKRNCFHKKKTKKKHVH